MKSFAPLCLAVATLVVSSPAFANVLVNSPSRNATVSTQTTFIASANTTTCSRGVASMGVYVDNGLRYVVNGTKLNASVSLTPGKHNAVVQEWDYCGGATKTAVPLTVAGSGNGGVVVTLPKPLSTVPPQTSFVATATSDCPTGVSAVGVYNNGQLLYEEKGATLNSQITLPEGLNHTVVQASDACGGVQSTSRRDSSGGGQHYYRYPGQQRMEEFRTDRSLLQRLCAELPRRHLGHAAEGPRAFQQH